MKEILCSNCGEPIADCRRPGAAYPEWRHTPWGEDRCELYAEPPKAAVG